MTAEIAILNRSGVALAADSAVTLGGAGNGKIFNSVDKLFQCVENEPVGIMIYGAASYMGVPIETLVKLFRDSTASKPKDHLFEYRDAFLEFLARQVPPNVAASRVMLARVAAKIVDDIAAEAVDEVQNAGGIVGPEDFNNKVSARVSALIAADLEKVEQLDDDESLVGIDATVLETQVRNALLNDVTILWVASDSEPFANLVRLVQLSIQKKGFPIGPMGVVFAGFGQAELFPSLTDVHICGAFEGRVKHKVIREVDIGRDGNASAIIPFAQTEMVERFVQGVDTEYRKFIHGVIWRTLERFSDHLISEADANDRERLGELSEAMRETYSKEIWKEAGDHLQQNQVREVLDIVDSMPKSDLAAMADSLVNLTSTKRRVSAQRETVGGPADVAVISKGDGFIWIKRKHYFEPELNPRYFSDKFRQIRSEAGED